MIFLLSSLLTSVRSVTTTSTPTYTIVAPAKIRPNSDYHLSVQLTNATYPADVTVEISGPGQDSVFKNISKYVSVNPQETRIMNLEIGEWSKGNYKLTVRGSSPEIRFTNETTLGFEPKAYSIFVQTDKAIYKPGQLIRFRAIIVNPSLIPNMPGSLDIYIKVIKV